MIAADFLGDIPLDVATAAHRGTSFSPDERGHQERGGYNVVHRRKTRAGFGGERIYFRAVDLAGRYWHGNSSGDHMIAHLRASSRSRS